MKKIVRFNKNRFNKTLGEAAQWIWSLFSKLLAMLVAGLAIYYIIVWAPDVQKWFAELGQFLESIGIYISKDVARSIVKDNPLKDTFFLFLMGVAFYWFKKRQQFWYGVVETLFAFTYGYLQFTSIQEEASSGSLRFTVLFTVLTVVYLTVRGVNNVDDGDKKEYWKKEEVRPLVDIVRGAFKGS